MKFTPNNTSFSFENLDHDNPWKDFSMCESMIHQQQQKPRGRKRLVGIAAVLLIVAIGFSSPYLWENSNQKFVLIRVKILSEQGHPVTGAQVSFNDQVDGRSDAFGEWQSFIKVRPDSTVRIGVHKEKKFSGYSSIHIPKKLNSEKTLELSTVINMEGPLRKNQSQLATHGKNARKFKAKQYPSFDSISFNFMPPGGNNMKDATKYFSKKIFPSLKRKMVQKGIPIASSSAWQAVFRLVEVGPKTAMIRTDIFWHFEPSQVQSTSFLTWFSANSEKTARRLLALIKFHTPKSFHAYEEGGSWYILQPSANIWHLNDFDLVVSKKGHTYPLATASKPSQRMRILTGKHPICEKKVSKCLVFLRTIGPSPPRSSQSQLTLRLDRPLPLSAQVYVSGVLARKLKPQIYSYWGTPGTRSKVTIITGTNLISRQKIANSATATPRLSLAEKKLVKF